MAMPVAAGNDYDSRRNAVELQKRMELVHGCRFEVDRQHYEWARLAMPLASNARLCPSLYHKDFINRTRTRHIFEGNQERDAKHLACLQPFFETRAEMLDDLNDMMTISMEAIGSSHCNKTGSKK